MTSITFYWGTFHKNCIILSYTISSTIHINQLQLDIKHKEKNKKNANQKTQQHTTQSHNDYHSVVYRSQKRQTGHQPHCNSHNHTKSTSSHSLHASYPPESKCKLRRMLNSKTENLVNN